MSGARSTSGVPYLRLRPRGDADAAVSEWDRHLVDVRSGQLDLEVITATAFALAVPRASSHDLLEPPLIIVGSFWCMGISQSFRRGDAEDAEAVLEDSGHVGAQG